MSRGRSGWLEQARAEGCPWTRFTNARHGENRKRTEQEFGRTGIHHHKIAARGGLGKNARCSCKLRKPQILGADCRGPGDESPGKIVEQWLTRHPIDRKGVRATYRLRGARPSEDSAEAPRPRGGRAAHSPILPQDSRCECDQVPASHFFRKLVFAAPASFLPSFPTAPASQHFFMELALAAPASAFPSLLTALAAHAAPS
jgi:hypothetical protein